MSGLEYISVNQVFGGICSPPAETVRVPWGATKKADCTVPVGLDYLKKNNTEKMPCSVPKEEREREGLTVDWVKGATALTSQSWSGT